MQKVIVIAGPTASGKTGLGIALANRLNGEIVSADSMQIYRRMDIGTAKPTPEELAAAPHHMIDIAEPDDNYSVSRYVDDAKCCCEDIISRGKLPIIVGGTGLYIDSLISGRDFAEAEYTDHLREDIDHEYEILGGNAMLDKLAEFDPERAQKLAPTDRRRIVRAIEVYLRTGITATEHDRRTRLLPPRYNAARIVLNCKDRELLYQRINLRVDLMVQQGLFEEVAALLASGLNEAHTSMQAIGYKEPAAALRGEISREEAIELIKMGSRRYAKRQLTWFRRSEGALWLNRDELSEAELVEHSIEYITTFLKT